MGVPTAGVKDFFPPPCLSVGRRRRGRTRMTQDMKVLVDRLDQLLGEQGLVACLSVLAHAIRAANDRSETPPSAEAEKRVGYAREYVANQIMGLAAFWRVHLPESQAR